MARFCHDRFMGTALASANIQCVAVEEVLAWVSGPILKSNAYEAPASKPVPPGDHPLEIRLAVSQKI
jgi:hypothetical protein